MQATDRKNTRATITFSSFSALVLLLACSFGCAPSSSTGDGKQNSSASSASNDTPEITDETLRD